MESNHRHPIYKIGALTPELLILISREFYLRAPLVKVCSHLLRMVTQSPSRYGRHSLYVAVPI